MKTMHKTFYNFGLVILTTAVIIFAAHATAFAQIPANDDFANARTLVLEGNSATESGNLSFSSSEPGEPQHAGLSGTSVWYKFTPPETVAARIKVFNSFFTPVLAVYTGASVNALTSVGFGVRNAASGVQADLTLAAGQTFYIAVATREIANEINGFQISLAAAPVAPNDNFAAAHDLGTRDDGNIAGTNFGATAEPGEPLSGYFPASKTVWYRWTPTVARSMFFEVSGNFNSNINVYSANVANPTLAQLNPLSVNSHLFSIDGRHAAKFFAQANKTYYISVDGYTGSANNPIGNFQLRFGFNRFGYTANFVGQVARMSVAIFRPSENLWYMNPNANVPLQTKYFGTGGDQPMPADYSGTGVTYYAIVRNENGYKTWYISNPSGTYYGIQWGLANDRAAVGDFDRDGRADLLAIRQTASGLIWYVRQSSNNALRVFQFGLNFDKPVFGDFDGDGATDIAVTRTGANGLTWHILKSGAGLSYSQYTALQFGLDADLRAAADYDGDGKTDVAVFRPENGLWYILRSSDSQVQTIQFGTAGDVPQPGDFNGDGRSEPVVFRPSNGTWYAARPTGVPAQNFDAFQWGLEGDIPVSSNANPQ